MTKEELAKWEATPTHELFDYVTEKDSSQRKHAALYVLERRKNQILERAAIGSAIAAFMSVIAAVLAVYATFATAK